MIRLPLLVNAESPSSLARYPVALREGARSVYLSSQARINKNKCTSFRALGKQQPAACNPLFLSSTAVALPRPSVAFTREHQLCGMVALVTQQRPAATTARAAHHKSATESEEETRESVATNSSSQKVFFGFRDVTSKEKEQLVSSVFSSVAESYDLMNDLMSLGLHRSWKDTFADLIYYPSFLPFNQVLQQHLHRQQQQQQHQQQLQQPCCFRVLDLAGGTGDIAFRLAERAERQREQQASILQKQHPQRLLRRPPQEQRLWDSSNLMHRSSSSDPKRASSLDVPCSTEDYAAATAVEGVVITICDINASMLRVGQRRALEHGYTVRPLIDFTGAAGAVLPCSSPQNQLLQEQHKFHQQHLLQQLNGQLESLISESMQHDNYPVGSLSFAHNASGFAAAPAAFPPNSNATDTSASLSWGETPAILQWVCCDGQQLPFASNSFDIVTIAFGLRNFSDIPRALREIFRVLKQGGRILCLEFSRLQAGGAALAAAYDMYSFAVLPLLGEFVVGDRAAYQYLVESIRKFPAQEELAALFADSGFHQISYANLAGGIVAIHSGFKI